MLLAPALKGSEQVILDCSGVRRRGIAEGIQINQEKLPLPSMHPLPRTALHHCWCQTVNLQAQHFTKPLEHQLSLSHATSAPQNSQLSLRGQPAPALPKATPASLQNRLGIYFWTSQTQHPPPAAGCTGISPGCSEMCHVLGPGGNTGLGKVTQISHPAHHPPGHPRSRAGQPGRATGKGAGSGLGKVKAADLSHGFSSPSLLHPVSLPSSSLLHRSCRPCCSSSGAPATEKISCWRTHGKPWGRAMAAR